MMILDAHHGEYKSQEKQMRELKDYLDKDSDLSRSVDMERQRYERSKNATPDPHIKMKVRPRKNSSKETELSNYDTRNPQ